MKQMRPVPKGAVRNFSGDFTRWANYNNITDTVISAEVTDGKSIVSISGFNYFGNEYSFLVTASNTGKAIITVTASSAILGDVDKQSMLIEVRDESKLPTGVNYGQERWR